MNALLRTLAATSSLFILCAARPATAAYLWHSVRVGGGGFAPGIVFSTAQKDLAYLRTDIGGLYRWDVAGKAWVQLQDAFAESNYFGVESVAPDPRDPKVVYAAVGMYHRGPAALIRSPDRGTTWQIFPTAFRMGGNEDGRGLGERLAVDPNDTSILYFGSRHDGLQRSGDRGRTWAKVAAFPVAGRGAPAHGSTHAGISFVIFDPASGRAGSRTRVLFAGVADEQGRGVYRSNDAGESWAPLPQQPQGLLPVQAQLDVRAVLYVTYANGPGPNGIGEGAVHRFDSRTDEWSEITPDKASTRPPGGYMGLSLDRQLPGALVVATVNRWRPGDTIWRTLDDGRTWRSLAQLSERDTQHVPFLKWGGAEPEFGHWMSGVAIDPFDSRRIAYTTGATVYVTRDLRQGDAGRSMQWQPWVEGIEETAVIALASPPSGAPLLSGFGDISGFTHEQLDASPARMWVTPTFNNTVFLDFAALAPHVLVRAGTPRVPRGNDTKDAAAFAWSDNQGRTWLPLRPPGASDRSGGTAITVTADGAAFVVMTPTPAITRDRGATWTQTRGLPQNLRVIADRKDPRLLYAVDFARALIHVSNDGGASFTAPATRGLPHAIQDDRPTHVDTPWPLLAAPDRSGDLWFVSRAGLFHSTDQGQSFSRVPSDVDVAVLGFGKAPPGRAYPALYAIGSRGELHAIWRSDDAGVTWLRVNDDQHEYGRRYRVIAGDPRIFGRVYVGTDGRGIVYGDIARDN
jgi:photosystem II stability/assembly factor-like uncharacterized protein